MTKKHTKARLEHQKQARREVILTAASGLFLASPEQLPTVSAIAKQAELGKGTVYLYFKSKEEIFLAIFEQHYVAWIDSVSSQLSTNEKNLNIVIEGLCKYVDSNSEFFQLANLSSAVIEQNVEPDVLTQHKATLAKHINTLAGQLQQFDQEKSAGEWAQLFVRTYAMLLGLWQLSNSCSAVEGSLDKASLNMLKPDFKAESRLALSELWSGYIVANKKKTGLGWGLSKLLGN